MLSGFVRRNLRFGILQRYVMGEVLRAFALALLTITAVFVLLTVMTKAASVGLGPYEILKLVPYMIPASLPYTVPVSLLFSATVVYGRLASDNEVIMPGQDPRRPRRDGPDLAVDPAMALAASALLLKSPQQQLHPQRQ